MIKIEAVEEMLISKAELGHKLFYLEATLKLELDPLTRRRALAQKQILVDEIKEIDEMLTGEFEDMNIASVMMDIYLAKPAHIALAERLINRNKIFPANTFRSKPVVKPSILTRLKRLFK